MHTTLTTAFEDMQKSVWYLICFMSDNIKKNVQKKQQAVIINPSI